MRLFIRFKSHSFSVHSLDEGRRYSLGRNTQSDIHLPFPQVTRDQGFIYHDGQSWIFEDHGTPQPRIHRLTDMTSANLKNGLEIMTEEFLDQEKTHQPLLHDHILVPISFLLNSKKILTGAFAALALIVTGLLGWHLQKPTIYNSQTMMSFAENRVVKFELKYNSENIEKLKKDGNFTDDDIRKNIGFCTGFIISKNVILTAHHCMAQPPGFSLIDDFNILTKDNRTITPKRVLGFDFVKDYLFLEVEGLSSDDKELKFATHSDIGEKVYTIGNVAGEGIAIREGIIAGVTEDPNDPQVEYVRFSAAASPGNSGGPLLNERGEVVALVSKKNFAENYNIGIRFQDLKQGYKDFVQKPGSREIKYSSSQNNLDITTVAYLLPRLFGMKVSDAFLARKELGEKFKDFQVTFQVPFNYSDRRTSYFENFMLEAEKLITEVNQEVSKKNLPGTTWETQPTQDLPLIAPVISEEIKTQFKLIQKKWLVPHFTGLVGHSGYAGYNQTLTEWKKTKNYSYSDGVMAQRVQLIENRFPNSGDNGYLIYSSVEDTKDPLNLSNMFYMSPDVSILYFEDKTKEEKENILKDAVKKVFFADSGALLDLKMIPYLRSKAKADLKLKDFPKPLEFVEALPDRHDRSWNYYRSDFYGVFFVEVYCHDFTQSTHCLTVVRDGDVANVQKNLVGNFVKTELSDKMALLDYYAPQNLQNISKESEIAFKDVTFQSQNKKIVSFIDKKNGLSYQISTPYEIQLVRPHAALQFSIEQSHWRATGFNFIKSLDTTLKKFEFCTTGIDQEKYKTNALLNIGDSDITRLVASISGQGQAKKSKTAKYWEQSVRSPANVDSTSFIYGSCFPMRSQPNQPEVFTLDPYKGKPFEIEVNQN